RRTDDGAVSGSTCGTLQIKNVSTADAGSYGVLVANDVGFASSGLALLTVFASPPVIVTQPTDQTVLPGATASFAVEAIGSAPLFYQWRNNGIDIATGGNASTLTIRNVSPTNTGAYSVVVSNAVGMVTNSPVLLAL